MVVIGINVCPAEHSRHFPPHFKLCGIVRIVRDGGKEEIMDWQPILHHWPFGDLLTLIRVRTLGNGSDVIYATLLLSPTSLSCTIERFVSEGITAGFGKCPAQDNKKLQEGL